MTKRKLELYAGFMQRDIRILLEQGEPYKHLEKKLDYIVNRIIVEHTMRRFHCG